jgi:hypothetical protein
MLISISLKGSQAPLLTTAMQLATDKVHVTELPFGKANVFFPTVEADRVEACLLLEVAAERLLSEKAFTGAGHPLRQYVHAVAYASGALMALGIGNAFEKALQHADSPSLALDITVTALVTRCDTATLHAWWKPLGWQINLLPQEITPHETEAGQSTVLDLRLRGNHRLGDALRQLQVMLCAMDEDHRFWLQDSELQGMLVTADALLQGHPHQSGIMAALTSYPDYRNRTNLGSLLEEDEVASLPPIAAAQLPPDLETAWNATAISLLTAQAFPKVLLLMPDTDALMTQLSGDAAITHVTAAHIEVSTLQAIVQGINLSGIPDAQKRKMALLPNSPLFKNPAILGYQAVVVSNMAARFPTWHHGAIDHMVFGFLAAQRIVWLGYKHPQFENWASGIAKTFAYDVQLQAVSTAFPDIFVAIFDQQTS